MFTPVNTVVGNHFFLLQTRFLLPLHSPELLMFVCMLCLVPDDSVTWDTRSRPLTLWLWHRGGVRPILAPRAARWGVAPALALA